MTKKLRKKLSKQRGEQITQQKLADMLGVSVRTVQSWECGARSPSRQTMNKLLELGIFN